MFGFGRMDGNGLTRPQTTEKLLCPQLDLSSPQRPRLSCCTRQVDCVWADRALDSPVMLKIDGQFFSNWTLNVKMSTVSSSLSLSCCCCFSSTRCKNLKLHYRLSLGVYVCIYNHVALYYILTLSLVNFIICGPICSTYLTWRTIFILLCDPVLHKDKKITSVLW